jgi:hypothetical protein
MMLVGGATDTLRSACFGSGGTTDAVRATGLGMMNAGCLLLGTSTALR